MNSFQQAFDSLMALAPGPVFPRARQLYLRKYPLETTATSGRFRTFLLEEEIQETPGGSVRVRAMAFAVVHWQAPQTTPADYLSYLLERWQLEPRELQLNVEGWFRAGGSYARFEAAAIYERVPSVDLLLGES